MQFSVQFPSGKLIRGLAPFGNSVRRIITVTGQASAADCLDKLSGKFHRL
jgi:hypothetical protein